MNSAKAYAVAFLEVCKENNSDVDSIISELKLVNDCFDSELIKFLESEIKNIIKTIGYDDEVVLNVSNRPELGDYQYNACMKLASIYKEKPIDIANKIVGALKSANYFSDINVAGPGFINLTINEETLINYINDIINNFEINTYKEEKQKTIFFS